MGRSKLTVKRIENPTSRQLAYSKRNDGIVKKARELSVLCDTDVALLMFSPSCRLTSFASRGRVEDVFLRFINRPDELKGGPIANEEFLCERLKQLKHEAEMLEKITKIEHLEEQLYKLNRRQLEAQAKMRYYAPDVETINSVFEVAVYQQFLSSAIQRIEESKVELLHHQIQPQNPQKVGMEDGDESVTGETSVSNGKRGK